MFFDFNISNHSLTIISSPEVFSGNENYYICNFNFSTSDWDNLSKFAVFAFDDTAISVPLENDQCPIPSEALNCEKAVSVGVFGFNPDDEEYKRISTGLVFLFVGDGAYREGAVPTAPTPDLWEKYYAEITKVGGFAQRAEESAESASFSATQAENSNLSAKQALSDLLKMIGEDIATLVDGKIPVSQIPSIATTEIYTVFSLEEMNSISAENGDICIRQDENKSYIYRDGWIFLVSPTDYASRSAYAETAKNAENAVKINNHRLVEISASEFETATHDPDTYYLVY